MYETVLVPIDGREPSKLALEYALDLAADYGGRIHLLYVADTNKASQIQYQGGVVDVLEREGEEVLSDAREWAADSAVPVEDELVQGQPREEIVAAAADADLVVMGTQGRSGLDAYLLGSVTEHVVRVSETPVLAVRPGSSTAYPYGGVLVPFDGSEHARAALERATEIATHHDATVHLLSIVEEPTFGGLVGTTDAARRKAAARDLLEETATGVSRADVVTAVEPGSVPDAIRDYADGPDVDLVVMGTHGRRGLDERVLGSTTERVLRASPVPVLTTTGADPERE